MPEDVFAPDPDPNVPTSAGDMYITPTPRPPLTPEQQAALQSNLAAMTSGPARAPIQPPSGMGGVGVAMPDMGPAYRAAFSHLPVNQAAKAVEAAIQYQGTRGYQRDIANGMPAAQAFSRWAPMLFHRSPGGLTESMRLAQPAPTPRVFPQGTAFGNRFYPAKPAPAPRLHFGPSGEIVEQPATGGFKVLRPRTVKPAEVTVRDPETGTTVTGYPDNPDVQAALRKQEELMPPAPKAPPPAPGFISRLFGAGKPAADTRYKVGGRYGNLRYKGGDPNVESNWEPVAK